MSAPCMCSEKVLSQVTCTFYCQPVHKAHQFCFCFFQGGLSRSLSPHLFQVLEQCHHDIFCSFRNINGAVEKLELVSLRDGGPAMLLFDGTLAIQVKECGRQSLKFSEVAREHIDYKVF